MVFGLVTPQDGLVTPQYGELRPTSLKSVPNLQKSSKSEDGPPEVWPGVPRMGIMCRPHGKMYFFDDFSIRALKLAANHEKQVFTFFAFLPPYIGVSGLLVYCKR